jgi:tetratricopeptide (TPR) repeat protein
MNAINRYVEAVKRYLPDEKSDDIGDEIRSTLEGQLEEAQNAKGASLDKTEINTLLRDFGHPFKTASECLDQKPLIGESLWPIYKKCMMFLLLFFLIAYTFSLTYGNSDADDGLWTDYRGGLISIALWCFATITLAFYFAKVAWTKFDPLSNWNPDRLPDPPAADYSIVPGYPVTLYTSVIYITFWMVQFIIMCHINNDYSWLVISGQSENDWFTVVFWVKVITVLNTLIHTSTLVWTYWSRLKVAFWAAGGVMETAVLVFAVTIENTWNWATPLLRGWLVIAVFSLLNILYRIFTEIHRFDGVIERHPFDSFKRADAIKHTKRAEELMRIARLLIAKDIEEMLPEINQCFESAVAASPDFGYVYLCWAHVFRELSKKLEGEKKHKYLMQAVDKLEKAEALNPEDLETLMRNGIYIAELGINIGGQEGIVFFKRALPMLEKADELDSGQWGTVAFWGISLAYLGENASGKDGVLLLNEAIGKLGKADELNPDYPFTIHMLAWANYLLGNIYSGEEKVVFLKESIRRYEHATNLEPEQASLYKGWGAAFGTLGIYLSGDESRDYFEKAIQKCMQAVKLDENEPSHYRLWGGILSYFGKEIGGVEGFRILEESFSKFERAFDLEPDFDSLFNVWGRALVIAGTLSDTEAKQSYFDEAREMYVKHLESDEKEDFYYNLACLSSHEKKYDECREWLEKFYSEGRLPLKSKFKEDTDFDNVRSEPWFKDFVDTLPELDE